MYEETSYKTPSLGDTTEHSGVYVIIHGGCYWIETGCCAEGINICMDVYMIITNNDKMCNART